MIPKQIVILSLTVSSLIVGYNKAQAITLSIDEFNTVQPVTSNSTSCANLFGIDPIPQPCLATIQDYKKASSYETHLNRYSVIGSVRQIELNWNGNDNFATSIAEVNPTAQDENGNETGTFSLLNDPGTYSNVRITWPGESNGLGSLGEYNAFVMRLVGTDLPAVIGITVTSTGGTTAVLNQQIFIGDEGRDFEFAFAEFTGDLTAFSSVKTIVMTINPALNALGRPIDDFDVTADFFRVIGPDPIPEPSLILGLSLACGIGIFSAKGKGKLK